MSSYKIEPETLHGISINIPDSVQHLSNHEVIYSSGGVLTIQNFTEGTQKFIKIKNDPDKIINLISIHPEKTHVTISSTSPKPIIEIYDISTRCLIKTISVVAPIITMGYSWDGGHLFYVTSELDPIMYYYNFELGKVENTTNATQPPAYLGPVTMIAGNPTDSMIVVVVGSGLFRLLNLSDSVWRQYGFQKAESYNFLSVCWISSDKLIAGTSDGRIILVDSGELKGIYRVAEANAIIPSTSKEELQAMSSNTVPKGSSQKPVVSIIGFSKGFAICIAPNRVIVFEKESNNKYLRKNEFNTDDEGIENIPKEELNKIFSISMSLDETTLICCTHRAQIYSVKINWSDKSNRGNQLKFIALGEKLHYGEIKNLSVCVWKPLIMTSGSVDRRVCLFNYEKKKLMFSQYFHNDIHSLAIHTSGLFCAIGFTDVCQISYIMMDRLKLAKKLSCKMKKEEYGPIRSCKVLHFSSYGHMLAAGDGVDVKVFDAIQFDLLYSLPGHRIEITAFKWILHDNILLSCGLDGAVYLWDVKLGKRLGDVVSRHSQYHSIAATSDGQLIYTVGEDGHLKEIKDQAVIQDLEVTNCSLSSLVMTRNDQVMVIADTRGLVLVVNYPVVQKVDYDQYCVHNKAVTNVKLIYENTHVVTCDEDGFLCIWKIVDSDGNDILPPEGLYRCKGILITEEELREKKETIKNLQARNKEVEIEQKFKIKELYRAHEESVKALKSEKESIVEKLNENIATIEKEKMEESTKLRNEKQEMIEKYEKELEAIEKHLKYKLLVREYEKSKNLEAQLSQLQDNHKEELLKLRENFEEQIRILKEEYAMELTQKNEKIGALVQSVEKEKKNQDIMKRIVEDDADRTIMEMQAHYEDLMAKEHTLYLKVKNDEGVCKEKIKLLDKEIQNAKNFQIKLEKEISDLESQNLNYKDRVEELGKEIIERENILIPKERRVHIMKSRLSVLEQEIRILKMKNQEFEKKIKPKDEEIAENEEIIQNLKQEILDTEKHIKQMNFRIKFLQESINTKNKNYQRELDKQREMKALLNKMKNDVYDVHEAMKNQKAEQLKIVVQKLHNKYVKGKTIEILLKEMKLVSNENLKQRQYLTNTITGLKRHITREIIQPTKMSLLTKEQKEHQNHNEGLKKILKQRNDKLKKSQEKIMDDEMGCTIRDKVHATAEENSELHIKCQGKIEELETTIEKLHEQLFELQKQNYFKKKEKLEVKSVPAEIHKITEDTNFNSNINISSTISSTIRTKSSVSS